MYRVIVADDEMLARDRICRYLGQIKSVEVVASVWNGQLVKEYLEQNVADLIISDIRMPVMDGLELAEWVRKNCPECHVVLISVYEDFAYAKRAIQFGVKSYLVKPISSEVLIQIVTQLLMERNEFEQKNLYVKNMQIGNNNVLSNEWFRHHKIVIPEHLRDVKGSLFVFEDMREDQNNRDLLPIALNNVLRWSAPRCDCVFLDHRNSNYLFVVLFPMEAFIPSEKSVKERAKRLLGEDIAVNRVGEFSNAEEFHLLAESINDRDEETIIRIKKYIDENLGNDINRDAAAAFACMAPTYFSKYFKKKTGMSYQEYVQLARMQEAERLLRKGMQIKLISERVGYQDRNYFTKLFKKHTGYSPMDYRQRMNDNADS